MTSGPNKDNLPTEQGKDITKQRVFKFLDGLRLGQMSHHFSPTGERNLANKFKVSIEVFKQYVEEHREGGQS